MFICMIVIYKLFTLYWVHLLCPTFNLTFAWFVKHTYNIHLDLTQKYFILHSIQFVQGYINIYTHIRIHILFARFKIIQINYISIMTISWHCCCKYHRTRREEQHKFSSAGVHIFDIITQYEWNHHNLILFVLLFPLEQLTLSSPN